MASTQTIASVLQPFVDNKTMSGAVTLVASPDKILSLEAVGYADLATRTPMRTDNLFWIASTSKPITATAMMMLVDEGKLNLEDPVEKYLPQFKGQMVVKYRDDEHVLLHRPKRPFLVRELLSHTSGLPGASCLQQSIIDTFTMREGTIAYAATPLNSEPGTRYEYSNPGINTAGRLIEIASGLAFADFVDQRLFHPLGMHDTTLWPSHEQLTRLAKSYRPNADKTDLVETKIELLTYPLDDRTRNPFPGGGFFSTATDLNEFALMVLNEGIHKGRRYLSAAAVKQMTSKQTGALPDEYGFGWSTQPSPGAGFGHGGAYSNHLWIDPAKKLVFIWMVQQAGYGGKDGDKVHPAFLQAALAAYG